MKHIIDDKADIVNLNSEELYLAGRMYNLEPFAMEQFNGGESRRWVSLGPLPQRTPAGVGRKVACSCGRGMFSSRPCPRPASGDPALIGLLLETARRRFIGICSAGRRLLESDGKPLIST